MLLASLVCMFTYLLIWLFKEFLWCYFYCKFSRSLVLAQSPQPYGKLQLLLLLLLLKAFFAYPIFHQFYAGFKKREQFYQRICFAYFNSRKISFSVNFHTQSVLFPWESNQSQSICKENTNTIAFRRVIQQL